MKMSKNGTIALAAILFSVIGYAIFLDTRQNSQIKNEGNTTVAITYDEYALGTGGTLRYFFKTPRGIYTGTSPILDIKSPGYYYKVKYYRDDPSLSQLMRDSLVPDSVGIHYILWNEINKNSVINADDVPDYQWK